MQKAIKEHFTIKGIIETFADESTSVYLAKRVQDLLLERKVYLQHKADFLNTVKEFYPEGAFGYEFWKWAWKVSYGQELKEVEEDLIHKVRLLLALEEKTPQRYQDTAGISDSDIRKAKRVPIQKFFHGHLKKTAGKLLGTCPFHEDNHPSFYIYLESNRFFCFGCQATGDVIDFVMKTRVFSFPKAVSFLINKKH